MAGSSESRNGNVELLPMFILDALKQLGGGKATCIVAMINDSGCVGWRMHWPRDFQTQEVILAVQSMLAEGLIYVTYLEGRHEESDQDGEVVSITDVDVTRDAGRLWFRLTEAGWRAWNKWVPPEEPD